MGTAFGTRTLTRSQLQRWLLERLYLLEDPVGQLTWAEIYVYFSEKLPVVLVDDAIIEPQSKDKAEEIFQGYFRRNCIQGRVRPPVACYHLAIHLLEEAVEQFAGHYKLSHDTARGLLMQLVLSGEVEIRRQGENCFYIEHPHTYMYESVRHYRQRFENVKGRGNIGGRPSGAH